MPSYIFSSILGYFVGSLPTAYLLLRWKASLDIREAGSGNVGAMNALQVSGSKFIGIWVLVIDVIKGVVAVGLCSLLWGTDVWMMAAGGLGAIVGHNYPIWLNFKGGRGLATAAGVMLYLGWLFVVVWILLWGLGYLISKHMHISNTVATILTPFLIILFPEWFVQATLPAYLNMTQFIWITVAVGVLILLGHIDPIIGVAKSVNQTKN